MWPVIIDTVYFKKSTRSSFPQIIHTSFIVILKITLTSRMTGPYWNHLRTHVDSSYKTLVQPDMRNMTEDHSSHYIDVEATFTDWLGYIKTWSGVQTMIKTRQEMTIGSGRKIHGQISMQNKIEQFLLNPTTNYLDSAKTNFSIYLKLNISQLGASCRFDWLTKVKQIYKPSCLMFHDPALMWNIYKSNISFLAGSVLFKKLVS